MCVAHENMIFSATATMFFDVVTVIMKRLYCLEVAMILGHLYLAANLI